MKGTVGFLAASWLVLPEAGNLTAFFINLHVPEPADIPEAAALLPQCADGFIAQSSFAVPEGTVVSLVTGGIEVEVAIISLLRHAGRALRSSSGLRNLRAGLPMLSQRAGSCFLGLNVFYCLDQ